ncbi:MAG TPA: hypothetical protein ENN29_09770 [Candidatus Hydrogenedentes bacterium]|nr:hypothetical protein [Candidatus Hydrogenedentota bacterium]
MSGELDMALALLRTENGLAADKRARVRLLDYMALLEAWRDALGLVSGGDKMFLERRHVADALSLAPYVARQTARGNGLLDIGSGGGLPAIPIKCVLPELPCTLVERSARKVGFLHRVAAQLGFSDVVILHGSFPDVMGAITASVITARAVERPQRLGPEILKRMPEEGVFLCQSDPRKWRMPGMFHVEHITDIWKQKGLRRGTLSRITHKKTENVPRGTVSRPPTRIDTVL